MPIISKHKFYEKLVETGKTCDVFHFNHPGCIEGNYWLMKNILWGTLKFFVPIYIIKSAINYKKLNSRKYLKGVVLQELRSTVYGILFGNLVVIFNCFHSKIFGTLNYYTFAWVAGMFSGLSVLVETTENRNMDSVIFFNMVIEACFRNLDYWKIFKLTRLRETLIFMATSGTLMHFLQNRERNLKFINFWFYMPKQLKETVEEDEKSNQNCYHKKNCLEYIYIGATKFFALGYAINIFRRLIPKMMTLHRAPSNLFKIIFSKANIKFGAFIGAYVGLYRYLTCTLFKTKIIDKKYYGIISGVISGATYAISPNLQVLIIGITTLFQLLYHHLLRLYKIKNYLVPQQIIFMLSNGFLLHNAIVSRESCPPFYLNMLEICTNNLWSEIYKKVIAIVYAA